MEPKTRIMYIEYKGNGGIVGDARIGRVTVKNDGKSLIYREQKFRTLRGKGSKSNYCDVQTLENYWISGCRKDGRDALYPNTIEIDDDVREEYWTEIRNLPSMKNIGCIRGNSKY
jgi:hypothetical protein